MRGIKPTNPTMKPGDRTPKLNEPTPVVTTTTPKLDPANSKKETVPEFNRKEVGPSTRPLADSKHAPQAGFNNTEQL